MRRRTLRSGLVFGAAACLAALLGACQPAFVPSDPDLAVVTVALDAEGGARLRGLLGGRDEAQLRTIGETLAPVAFPERDPSVEIDGNGGSPFLLVRAAGVYETGGSTRYAVALGKIAHVLRRDGFTRGTISVCFPDVHVVVESGPDRSLTDGCVTSPIAGMDKTTAVEAVMTPSPFRWIFSVVLLVGAGAAATVAVRKLRSSPWTPRRRLEAIAAGAVGCLAVLFALGGLGSGPEIGVAGLLSGPPLIAASILPRLTPLLAIVCLVVIVLAIDRTKFAKPTAVDAG